MKLVLEVRAGPGTGRSFVIEPGSEAIVGRAAPAHLILADDLTVSRRHFAIGHDGRECRLRDLGSSHGTTINGARVGSAVVAPGDVIGLGTTLLRVRFALAAPESTLVVVGGRAVASAAELHSEAPVATAEHAVLEPRPVDGVLDFLRARRAPLYAILDAARDPMVHLRIIECPEQKQSLYEGPQAVELGFVAPYLITLPRESPFLEGLVREGWGESWGVFLTSDEPFDAVRKHLRRFLTVELEGGKAVLFRFYDPRVLSVFLPTCTPGERAEFFGPIRRYLMESEAEGAALEFAADRAEARVHPTRPAVVV